MGNWFAEKLGAAQPQQQPTYDPRFVPPPLTPQQHQQQVVQAQPQQQQPVNGVAIMQALRQGEITFQDAVRLGLRAGGNQKNGAARHETQSCPECGDARYFTRERAGGKVNGFAPKPICMACGHTGDGHVQFGAQDIPAGTPVWEG